MNKSSKSAFGQPACIFKSLLQVAGKCIFLFLMVLTVGCEKDTSISQAQDASPNFRLLKKEDTGLDFQNVIKQELDFNVFNYMYFFNGGGVGAGDFNQDGLVDLFFTSNMGPNRLYLNLGNLQFKDITEAAGMKGLEGWTTGASVVDINNDGLLDVYVSQVGDYKTIKGVNQLWVCQGIENGIPVFKDEAAAYGLDFVGFSTQASFFDYDLDGDLDMFLLNHSLHANGTFGKKDAFEGTIHPESGDKIYKNTNGRFQDVTESSGLISTVIGYGLGVVTGDVNNDGWPDIYVGNDFHENDYLYLNQGDGTFREALTEMIQHTSRFSMGVDMADINNDGNEDIISLDMMPEDPVILKSSLGEDDYGVFHFKLGYGYNYQFARNNLQLNNGDNTFSEIGIYAGVHATDWSWAPLFIDFDNDGFKDLFISNGIPRRMNDIDYVNFRKSNEEFRWKTQLDNTEETELTVVEKMPRIKLSNKFFKNNGQLGFEDLSNTVENNNPTFSNGSVAVDLDNDGDLDMVVNNLEDEPYLYENLLNQKGATKKDFLSLAFKGPDKNRNGIGTTVVLFLKSGNVVKNSFFPVRGYQSSAIANLHIGVGDASIIDSALVIWPDRSYASFEPRYNSRDTLVYLDNLPRFDFSTLSKDRVPNAGNIILEDITASTQLAFKHEENPFVEFNRETLIPFMVSQNGPALAVGDVNGDGFQDVFLGSAKRTPSVLFLQNSDGTFTEATPEIITMDSLLEDVDATWVDLENDGDLDLVIAAGGNEYRGQNEARQQRAYINENGKLTSRLDFKNIFSTASKVLAADVNKDGNTDLLFTGRAVPWNYGLVPETFLLINKGNLEFENATSDWSEELAEAGLVRNGTFTDFDQDGDFDILLALEWEPPVLFENTGKSFTKRILADEKGWWNFLFPADLDGDGDLDILAGNTGENNKLKPSPDRPVCMYVDDFDENGQIEQILTYHLKDREIPFANYEELTNQLVYLKKKYLYARDMAEADLGELFGDEKLKASKKWVANNFSNGYFRNEGNMDFTFIPFPADLQFSSLMAALPLEVDDNTKWLLTGNFYPNNIEMGRYDANFGNLLTFDKNGSMQVEDLGKIKLKGEVRNMQPIRINGQDCVILARNDDTVIILKIDKPDL
jgi:hypothetical protein